ncbi:Predicted chitinase [Pseudomonas sp. ok272]|nr:Predicted chitinase [Pseudomonas sp. ok272]SFN47033.1 Predicted chitinase [Pseudomonas sp. ok602]
MRTRLHDIIDRNRDGQLTAEELQTALSVPAHAQSIARLVFSYDSEWRYTPRKWDALDDILGHTHSTPILNWIEEKKRIKELSWWDEVAGEVGLPMGGEVFYFHPIGLMGSFSEVNPLTITHNQLKQIFPAASDDDIDIVINEINERLVEFKLDTRLRQRHFFAQIKGEVGAAMKGITESWEYSPRALKAFSVYYRQHPTEAEEDGYLKDSRGVIIRRANQREIGRKHFQRLNGNRASHPDDGYIFRGRGLIQITGYEKYHNFMSEYEKYWQDVTPNTISTPDLVNKMPFAIRSALWFWLTERVYNSEHGNGILDVKKITKKINGGDMGLEERRMAYEVIEGVLE